MRNGRRLEGDARTFGDRPISEERTRQRKLLATIEHKAKTEETADVDESSWWDGFKERRSRAWATVTGRRRGMGGGRRKYEGALPKSLLVASLCIRLIGMSSYEPTISPFHA
jgi:hypothetical protein